MGEKIEHGSVLVMYEDESLLVIDKPRGLMVHSDGRTKEKTLVDWLITEKCVAPEVGEPWIDGSGQSIPRPGIVHRLDKDTTGVLLIAKTQDMYDWLKEQFKSRRVEKVYYARVYGRVKEDKGVISKPIGRSSSDFRKKSAQRGMKGEVRDAVTAYSVLERYDMQGDGETLLELRPKTGRTHQLRVHMQYMHHPIVGDTLYGGKRAAADSRPLCLRAVQITVPLPDGSTRTFSVANRHFYDTLPQS